MGSCASTQGPSNSPASAPFVPFREDEMANLFTIDFQHPINKNGKGYIYKCVEIATGQVNNSNSTCPS